MGWGGLSVLNILKYSTVWLSNETEAIFSAGPPTNINQLRGATAALFNCGASERSLGSAVAFGILWAFSSSFWRHGLVPERSERSERACSYYWIQL